MNKANFLVIFFVLGFVLMILPIIHRAAVLSTENSWSSDFVEPFSGIDRLSNTEREIDSESGVTYIRLNDEESDGYIISDLIESEGDFRGWDKVELEIDLNDPGIATFSEDFSTKDHMSLATNGSWDGGIDVDFEKKNATLPTGWQVTSENYRISQISVSGDLIVWDDLDTNQIYMCNQELNGESGGCYQGDIKTMITNGLGNNIKPFASKDRIVWERDQAIYMCDYSLNGNDGGCLSGDEKTIIVSDDAGQPSISGDYIVWEDTRSGLNIYLYNLRDGSEIEVSNSSSIAPNGPRISGDYIVWQDLDLTARKSNIYYRQINSDGSLEDVQSIPGLMYDRSSPDIAGSHIVWQEDRVRCYDLESESFVSELDEINANGGNPRVWPDFVVWDENVDGITKIFGYHISQDEVVEFPFDGNYQAIPDISGGQVVYYVNSGGEYGLGGIYYSQLDRELVLVDGGVYELNSLRGDKNYAVYDDSYNIFLIDMIEGTRSQVTDSLDANHADVGDGHIVWVENSSFFGGDMRYCSLAQNGSEGGCLQNDTKYSGPSNVITPKISDERIVWSDYYGVDEKMAWCDISDYDCDAIYFNSTATVMRYFDICNEYFVGDRTYRGMLFELFEHVYVSDIGVNRDVSFSVDGSANNKIGVVTNGEQISWIDNSDGTDYDIKICELYNDTSAGTTNYTCGATDLGGSTLKTLTEDSSNLFAAAALSINDEYLLWADPREEVYTNQSLFTYDISESQAEKRITHNGTTKLPSTILDNFYIWQDTAYEGSIERAGGDTNIVARKIIEYPTDRSYEVVSSNLAPGFDPVTSVIFEVDDINDLHAEGSTDANRNFYPLSECREEVYDSEDPENTCESIYDFDVQYFVTNNGIDWTGVTDGEEIIFDDPSGDMLMWKAVMNTTTSFLTPVVRQVDLTFETQVTGAELTILDSLENPISDTFNLSEGINTVPIADVAGEQIKLRVDLNTIDAEFSPYLKSWRVDWINEVISDPYLDSIEVNAPDVDISGGTAFSVDIELKDNFDERYADNLSLELNYSPVDFIDAPLNITTVEGIANLNLVSDEVYSGEVEIKVCYGEICGMDTVNIVQPVCGDGELEGDEECDDGNLEAGDGCDAECNAENLKVFITDDDVLEAGVFSGLVSGKIFYDYYAPSEHIRYVGIEAADMICQQTAENAGLSGDFRAWLSTESYSPATNWVISEDLPYVLADGTIIAESWSDLTDGELDHSINVSARGEISDRYSFFKVYTGTSANGTANFGDDLTGDLFCDGWNSVDASVLVTTGDRSIADSGWTNSSAVNCSSMSFLYCFQTLGVREYGVLPICSDGIVDTGEDCDDGNYNNLDSCTNECLNAGCGDGYLREDLELGDFGYEECDDGNIVAGDGCDEACNIEVVVVRPRPICGNGLIESGEYCDDGNTVDGDGCDENCLIEALDICGNGILEGDEECDGEEFGGLTCESLEMGFVSGDLVCSSSCEIDTAECLITAGGGGGTDTPEGPGPGEEPEGPTEPDTPEEPEEPGEPEGPSPLEPIITPIISVVETISEGVSGVIEAAGLVMTDVAETTSEDVVKPIRDYYLDGLSRQTQLDKIVEFYITPIITAIAALNLINAIPLVGSLIPFIQYLLQFLNVLFTEPTYIFAKKRKKWGTIYDSVTQEPIALAVVRLYDLQTNKLVSTRITDKAGRYYFIVDPKNRYRLEVKSADYTFPANRDEFLKTKNNIFKKNYFGQEIDLDYEAEQEFGKINPGLKEKEYDKGLINYDVPLDLRVGAVGIAGYTKKMYTKLDNWENYQNAGAKEKNQELKKIKRQIRERKLSSYVAYFGFLTTAISLAVSPSVYLLGLFILHSVLLSAFIFLAQKQGYKPWGQVMDKNNGKGIEQVVVRLFDENRGKLLMTQVSSSGGRYGFLAESRQNYFLTGEKENYEMPKEKFEAEANEEGVIKKNIWLKKK